MKRIEGSRCPTEMYRTQIYLFEGREISESAMVIQDYSPTHWTVYGDGSTEIRHYSDEDEKKIMEALHNLDRILHQCRPL